MYAISELKNVSRNLEGNAATPLARNYKVGEVGKGRFSKKFQTAGKARCSSLNLLSLDTFVILLMTALNCCLVSRALMKRASCRRETAVENISGEMSVITTSWNSTVASRSVNINDSILLFMLMDCTFSESSEFTDGSKYNINVTNSVQTLQSTVRSDKKKAIQQVTETLAPFCIKYVV